MTIVVTCLWWQFRAIAVEETTVETEHAATEARLLDSVQFLASDELEGRGVGTEGIERAAEYIAERFAELGLRTDLFDGTPFQQFTISMTAELGEEALNYLTFTGTATNADAESASPTEIKIELETDYFPLAIGSSGTTDDALVFCGYGITATDLAYDDYEDIDVTDKVVIILRKEPNQGDENSVFDGTRPSTHATFQRKLRNAVEHGAKAVIFVNDNYEINQRLAERRKALDKTLFLLTAAHAEHRALDSPNEEQVGEYLTKIETLTKRAHELSQELGSDRLDELVSFQQAGTRREAEIPVFFVARKHIDQILGADGKPDLAKIEAEIDANTRPKSFVLDGWGVNGSIDIVTRQQKVKNVVGVLEGEGALADETIIIGAHYDHLGMGGAGSLAPWTISIHNGADDNASGTSAMLEIARRFALRETKPQRRLVFIAFTAEERGLLGSEHYVKNPRFDLDKTVAMVNLDMVGRLTDKKLTVYGTGTAEEFDELVDRLNEEYEFEVRKSASGFGPSDHASFYAKDIPVLFPFTGMHRDYHRPSDDWDTINYEGMRRVTDFTTDLVQTIDEMPTRPTLVKRGRLGFKFDRFGGRRSGERRGRDRGAERDDNQEARERNTEAENNPTDNDSRQEPQERSNRSRTNRERPGREARDAERNGSPRTSEPAAERPVTPQP